MDLYMLTGDRRTGRTLVWAATAVPLLVALLVVLVVSTTDTMLGSPSSFDGVRTLDVRTDHGDVEVVGADVTDVRVTRRARGAGPRVESWGDGSLTVGLVCDDTGSICGPIRDTAESHTDYAFVVPRDIEVTIRSDHGDVTVRGVTGKVDARTETGRLRQDAPAPG
ncbi:hypothetical protein DI270_004310 [Microbispora triticiradicis]|uniref:DUF4097 domain-containing protein n=2 Tax=Microbispora triticiradicis TaxID=2200763 RepID=A0A5R8YNC0_9ACTN|nr:MULTISPECIES: hypothetical protein [Microbispora]RGA06269.1 hypothetical protein DI270_004310 [Microbispora triticiradicis]TLP54595.1 hypothetical protein FED44_28010 [Microbispora fusca]GLW20804.1 hypothetical protein Mame01_08470 [Microbispora amethystogenes]